MILKGANLDGAPGDALNHARQFVWCHHNYVADLEWAISMQRDSGEEVSQRVLQGETDDHAEQRRGSEERAEVVLAVDVSERDDKKDGEGEQRKDISDQRRCFVALAKAENKVKEDPIKQPHRQVTEQRCQPEDRDFPQICVLANRQSELEIPQIKIESQTDDCRGEQEKNNFLVSISLSSHSASHQLKSAV